MTAEGMERAAGDQDHPGTLLEGESGSLRGSAREASVRGQEDPTLLQAGLQKP